MTFIIHAPNVHQGGGRTLLLSLLAAVKDTGPCHAILDTRLDIPAPLAAGMVIRRAPPTLSGRFNAELQLKNISRKQDIVLCFGNLPPLFPVAGRVILFLQNRYLIGTLSTNAFPPRVRLRLIAERLWLRWRLSNTVRVIVQTPSMKGEAEKALGVMASVLPFVPTLAPEGSPRDIARPRNAAVHDFLYVASPEPHKNHHALLDAWTILAAEGIFPSLCLTLGEEDAPALCNRVSELKVRYGLKVALTGPLSREEVFRLYRQVGALIYPSFSESLGLPLLEAQAAGLPILAAERDYVRDILAPDETFDPASPLSIARAVKRSLGCPDDLLKILNASQFRDAILKDLF